MRTRSCPSIPRWGTSSSSGADLKAYVVDDRLGESVDHGSDERCPVGLGKPLKVGTEDHSCHVVLELRLGLESSRVRGEFQFSGDSPSTSSIALTIRTMLPSPPQSVTSWPSRRSTAARFRNSASWSS